MKLSRNVKPWGYLLIFAVVGMAFHVAEARGGRPKIELQCKHVSPIEQSYLARHINHTRGTKNLEKRTVAQFIKKLDSSKIYLLQGDIKNIKKMMSNIYAKTKAKDCKAIQKTHALLVKRVGERVNFVRSFLGKKYKFNDKTELVLDPDVRKYPATVKQANAFHRKYMHFQVSNYLATEMRLEEAKSNVIRNYERVYRRMREMDSEDLLSLYLDAFAHSLDPHSSYLSADALEDFEIQMRLSLEGIGATLSSRDGFTVIEQLIPGGAAERSGKLKPKDKIVAVGQGANKATAKSKGKFDNVIEMDLRDVVRKIRGKKGTTVRLNILRKEGKKTKRFEVSLVRDKIKLEDEAASMTYLDREVNLGAGKKATRKIGLLNLPSFYADNRRNGRSAAKDMKKLLAEANKKKVDAVVLDFSTNGGGSLDDAVKIAGLFFKTGNVVKQSNRDPARGEIELADEDGMVDYSGPLVVLTSRISASASEIVAGTLQDYGRAVIVGGDHTFGKGSVQSVEPLPRGLGALKTTVGMFFVAGGKSTQHRGVDADIVFPSAYSTDEIGEKTLDYSLPPRKVRDFRSKTAYVKSGSGAWKAIDGATVKGLRNRSLKRVKSTKDFDKVVENKKKAAKRGKLIKVSEVLKGGEDDSDSKGDKTAKKKKKEDETVALTREEKKKKYLERADIQEAINIAVDYSSFATGNPGAVITIGSKPSEAKSSKAHSAN